MKSSIRQTTRLIRITDIQVSCILSLWVSASKSISNSQKGWSQSELWVKGGYSWSSVNWKAPFGGDSVAAAISLSLSDSKQNSHDFPDSDMVWNNGRFINTSLLNCLFPLCPEIHSIYNFFKTSFQ